MNLLPTADQVQIIDALRSFLQAKGPLSDSPGSAGPAGRDRGTGGAGLWTGLAEMGALGLSIAEEDGGTGLTAAEEMLAFREFGRALLAPAVLGSSLGARLAVRCGDRALLGEILSGRQRVGLANPREPATIGPETSGAFHLIAAHDAPFVLACDEQGAALLRRPAPGSIAAAPATDHLLSLERTRFDGVAPVLWVSAQDEPVHQRAMLLLAAYATGMAEATRDMAVAYAKVRQQFGQPIGAFQAVKHRCAEMAIRTEAALCQSAFAALAFDQAERERARGRSADAAFQVTAARMVATDAALRNAASNIQVHGAFGFTAEADAHLFLKRAHVVDLLWQDPRQRRASMLKAAFPD